MIKINFLPESLFLFYSNIIFRFFLGIALYLLSVYVMFNHVWSITSLKIVNLLGVYAFFHYTVFSIIDGGLKRLAAFHINNNIAYTNRQPIKWYLSNYLNISKFIKLLFYFFYVYACVMYLIYIP